MEHVHARRLWHLALCFPGLAAALALAVWLNGSRPQVVTAALSSAPLDVPLSGPITTTDAYTSYLPFVTHTYGLMCRVDDFSDPTSGWPNRNGRVAGSEMYYDNGVYRIWDMPVWPTYYRLSASPEWGVPNDATIRVRAKIDANGDTSKGFSPAIGVVYGLKLYDDEYVTDVWVEWYDFVISPHSQSYWVTRWWNAGGDSSTVASGTSSAILTDPQAWQTIEVRRSGTAMTLVVNGTVIGTVSDTSARPFTGRHSVGIAVGDVYTATFDDFSVCAYGVITAPVTIAASSGWSVR